jgi:hypothetical protein
LPGLTLGVFMSSMLFSDMLRFLSVS